MNKVIKISNKLYWNTISDFLSFWFDEDRFPNQSDQETFDLYYKNYRKNFNPYIRYHYENQSKEIVGAIKKTPNLKLLDIGSGCGSESLYFAYLGAEVTAIDITLERLSVAIARKKVLHDLNIYLKLDYVHSSIFDFSGTFNFIWLEQTFHHIEPRESIYQKFNELLPKGGRVFICEANGWNLLIQLQLLYQRGWKTKITLLDKNGNLIPYGNERITVLFFLIKEFKTHGFDVEKVRYFRMFPNFNLPVFWLKFENFLISVFPFLATHYNIVFKKVR